MLKFNTLTFDKLGGIQTKKALTSFYAHEALSCVGGVFNKNGAYEKRKGGEKYNTTALSSISGIYEFRYNQDQSSELIIAAGTQIYTGNGGSPSSIQTGMTSGSYYDFATYNDKCYMVNGQNQGLWYDGTNVYGIGISPPSSNATLAANTSGTLALGTYLINVTFVNADGEESNPYSSDASITLTGVQDQIDLINIPTSSDSQVTARNIYMSAVDGAILRLQQTINDNTTTTGTITSDAAGALLEYDHDVLPSGVAGIEVHKDRLMAFKGNTLYIGKSYEEAAYFPQGTLDAAVDYTIQLGDSSPIIGIKSYFDILLIFKKYDIFILSGSNEFDFRVDRLRTDERVGCVSDRTIKVIDNWCYFLGANGVYRTDGVSVQEISSAISDFFEQDSSDSTYKINKNYMHLACAEYYKEKNVYLLFITTGSETSNNMCFTFYVKKIGLDQESGEIWGNWSPWPGLDTEAATIVLEDGVEKWFRGNSDGYVFRQEALDGDGSNISSTATSGTATTLVDTAQSMTVNLYAGLRITITEGTGAGQERIISSNTADTFTVSTSWDTNPDNTSEYTVGGIPWHYKHSYNAYGNPSLSKRLRWVRPRFETSGDYTVDLSYGFDFLEGDTDQASYSIVGQTLWDVGLWDVGVWDSTVVLQEKISVLGSRIHRWSNFTVANNNAGQPISYYGFDKIFQMKGIR